jgi:tripartite-type tricarboxylate transporter receptor subunit TctC
MKYLLALITSFSLSLVNLATAAGYPEQEVQLVVNYGAGGVTDVGTRLLGKALEKQLKKPVVVVNKPGAQATLGPAYVARSKPDGYTVGVVTYASIAMVPHLIEVPYVINDFDYVGTFGRYRYGLVVNASSPYKTVGDFVDAAKKTTKPFFFGVPGAPNNIAFFELAKLSGAKFEQVLYKSGIESVSAVASDQVQATIQTPSEILPMVDSGRLRLLASVSPERWPDRPEVPTMKEAGYDVSITSWLGLALPKGVPLEVRERLESALAAAMKDPELINGLNQMGIDPVWLSGPAYQDKIIKGSKEMRTQLEQTGQPLVKLKP